MRAAILTCFALLGCDAVLGIEPLPHPVPDAAIDAEAPSACARCTDASCAAPVAACVADDACNGGYQQVASCAVDQPQCRIDFEKDHVRRDDGLYVAADSCRRLACSDECYGGGFAVALDKTCACAEAACAAEERACVRSGEHREGERIGTCDRTFSCITESPDPDSYLVCRSSGIASAEVDALSRCLRDHACDGCGLAKGELGCLGNYRFASSDTFPIHFGVKVVSATDAPIGGATIRTCQGASPACESFTATDTTDANGTKTIDIPAMTDGFVQVLPPDGSLESHFYWNRTIHVDEQAVTVRVLDQTTIGAYAATLGVTLDPNRGHLVGTVRDCIWNPLQGASFGSYASTGDPRKGILDDPLAAAGFFDGATLKKGAATTRGGTFVILNLAPGVHTLVVFLGDTLYSVFRHNVSRNVVNGVDVFPRTRDG